MREILKNFPNLHVNWKNEKGYTALHHACYNGHDSIVSILLAHPDIVVNQKTSDGLTPFYTACQNGRTSCVRLLLKDSRVKVNETNNGGSTPLRYAAHRGHLDIIKSWIASGREMDLGTPGNSQTDALGEAKKYGETAVAPLLERFKENPEETRHRMRVQLGWYDEAAVEVFALVVFVCDGLLKTKATNVKAGAKRTRFFAIVARLPLELQMILCRRVVGSMGENIPNGQREKAFKELAEYFLNK